MQASTRLSVILLLFICAPVTANGAFPLNNALSQLCEKMKGCTLQEMRNTTSLKPEMRQMIEETVNRMCDSVLDVSRIEGHTRLVEPAMACVNSMLEQSCESLKSANMQTPACQEYKQVAADYTR